MTPHLYKIANLKSDGLTNKEIAARLGKSEQTIKNQVRDIYRRLNVSNVGTLMKKLREA